VLLGSGAALAPALLDRDPVQPATPPGTSDLDLPDHLSAPPAALSEQDPDGSWSAEQVSTDLAVGTAAAAWVTPDGLPVVVDAETGEHHLLDLPDVVSSNRVVNNGFGVGWQPVVLSPDGTRLAYAYARHLIRQDVRTVDSGVRVVDLTTGDTAWTSRLRGGYGILVTSLSWSPRGEDLAFTGQRLRVWSESSMGDGTPVAGVVDDEGRVRTVEVHGGSSAVTDDSSTLFVLDERRLTTYLDCRTATPCDPVRRPWSPPAPLQTGTALSPDGERIAVGGPLFDWVVLDTDPARDTPLVPQVGPAGAPDDGTWEQHVLGWVDQAHLLLLRGDGRGDATMDLVAVDPQTGPSVEVGTVDAEVGIPSIAIELVTLERPTVDRPAPDWPGDGVPSPLLGFVLALGLGLLLVAGVVALLRRVTR
jgi:hypothetical protein